MPRTDRRQTRYTFADAFWDHATPANLELIGLVHCHEPGCAVYLDPINVPSCRCREHQAQPRRDAQHKPAYA